MTPARERAIRGHIRNFLVGLSESEVQLVLLDAIKKGDTVRIKYTNGWLGELIAENAACSDQDDWLEIAGCKAYPEKRPVGDIQVATKPRNEVVLCSATTLLDFHNATTTAIALKITDSRAVTIL